MRRRTSAVVCVLTLAALPGLRAQQNWTGARFGEVIALGYSPRDILLDELRGRIYAVNSTANRVDIYDYNQKHLAGSIRVGTYPISVAMDMDSAYLYVANTGSATLSVIDLGSDTVIQTVSLPTKPEGLAVGSDQRVLITTQGSGTNNASNQLLIFDRAQQQYQQLTPVLVPPPITTPAPLPQLFVGRPATAFPGKLIRTSDGNFIIGMVAINQTLNSAQTTLFVYEVASGVVLANRTVTGQSTVLSLSPDNARLMAGNTLYDTATLSVIGQLSAANLPFFTATTTSPAFNIQQNFGGSAFSPDGETLYGAFNVAPAAIPAQRPQSTVLYVSNPRNLGVRLGIKLPESINGKIIISQDGAGAWAVSESGMLHLPLAALYDNPIIWPETSQVFLASDECNRGIARANLRVTNLGKGRLTFTVPANIPGAGTALIAQQSSGLAPAAITFTMEPGRSGVVRQPGTNLFTGNTGNSINVALATSDAINIPNAIRVFMNFRQPDQRGIIYPVPATPSAGEGLQQLILDESRGRVYISNSGYNRVEVFDIRKLKFLEPIEVGQRPHPLAMSLDGDTLYTGNYGGESISIVNLTLDPPRMTGQAEFPPIPRAGNQVSIYPYAMATSIMGLQFVMNNGTLWHLIGAQAVPRSASPVIGVDGNGRQCTLNSVPVQMVSSPGAEYILLLSGPGTSACTIPPGTAFLYSALQNDFTTSRTLYTQLPIISYFGALAAAPRGDFFLVNGLVLNSALSIIGGAERPGAVQNLPPANPNQPAGQVVVSAGLRNVAAVYAIDENTFVRLTTPVKQNVNSTTQDDPRPTLELIDIRTGGQSSVGVAAEQPAASVYGQTRVDVPPRRMVVDSSGTAYAITISGLSVIPLAASGSSSRPQIAAGARGILNAVDGTPNFKPGSFITVNGTNLAAAATADQIPLPSVLGGSCVVFNDLAIPLLETSPGQMSAQVPETLRPGVNVVQVRSLATAQSSDPIVVTVQRP